MINDDKGKHLSGVVTAKSQANPSDRALGTSTAKDGFWSLPVFRDARKNAEKSPAARAAFASE
jgi:hypothetical protein